MLRLILLLAGLLLVVRWYRVTRWDWDWEPIPADKPRRWRLVLDVIVEPRQSQSKRSSARRGSLGRVLGLSPSLIAKVVELQGRWHRNGTEASNSIFMDGFKLPPDHPIRDY